MERQKIELPERLIPASRAFDYAVFFLMFMAFSLSNSLWVTLEVSTGVSSYFVLIITSLVAFSTIVSPLISSKPTSVDFLKTMPLSRRIKFRRTKKGNTRVVDLVFWQYIIISDKDFRRNSSERNAILHHEYAHLHFNDAKFFQIITIIYFTSIIQYPAFILSSIILTYNKLTIQSISIGSTYTVKQLAFDMWHDKPLIFFTWMLILFIILSTYLYRECIFNREYNADYFSYKTSGLNIYNVIQKIQSRNELEKNSSNYYNFVNMIKLSISKMTHPRPEARYRYNNTDKTLFVKNSFNSGLIFSSSMLITFHFLILLENGPENGNIINNINTYFGEYYVYTSYILLMLTIIYIFAYTSININLLVKKRNIIYSLYFLFIFNSAVFVFMSLVFFSAQFVLETPSKLGNNFDLLQDMMISTAESIDYCIIIFVIHWVALRTTKIRTNGIFINSAIGLISISTTLNVDITPNILRYLYVFNPTP